MNNILFTDTRGVVSEYFPKPAKSFIPEWYQKTKSYIEKKEVTERGTSATIKKCVPVLDILSAGYIIPTWSDIWVTKKDNERVLITHNSVMKIETHPKPQIENHPERKNNDVAFKFLNPWSIKTPLGYSCLFVAPFHNPNPYFEALSALVDTDDYSVPVNLPFFLKSDDFEGLIPAGTPLIQVIPFKRENWKMSFGNREDEINAAKREVELKTLLFNSYRRLFWRKKEFN